MHNLRMIHRPACLSPAMLRVGSIVVGLLVAVTAWGSGSTDAEDFEQSTARFQLTYNWQQHAAFRAPYSGPNSLSAGRDKMYTASATAHLGFRPWQNGEIYFNPEMAQGVPFTGALVGLGGFTNGEITRAAGPDPKLYRQRLFLRQTWNQGGGEEKIDADVNRMAGHADKNRVVLTAGNFSTLDVFDDNDYAKDPRTQFMNWGNWTYAAYDYAADSRGFGWGAALEWYVQDTVLRLGRMSGPREPNGLQVDTQLLRHYGDQAEIEHRHVLDGRPGKVRLLLWRNRARLASYRDALDWLRLNPGPHPDPAALIAVRHAEKTKGGLGINLEQELNPVIGLFVRAMKADGHTETHAYTEADASVSVGAQVRGGAWKRPRDVVGIAFGHNALSHDRRTFLEAGGTSFFIGDGALRYRPELSMETYYSYPVGEHAWLTADLQHIHNPAYNADRGPVHVVAMRLHAEF